MHYATDCYPCLVKQAAETIKRLGGAPAAEDALLRQVLAFLSAYPGDDPAPVLAQQIHRDIRAWAGDPDPFRALKEESNALALAWMPRLRERVQAAAEPLAVALQIAIAGNIIDYGILHQITPAQVADTLERVLATPLPVDALTAARNAIAAARSIVYLADNAGEIVFDRLLIELLPRERVTLIVRGAPILNDATRADAQAAGFEGLVEILDNGCDLPGTQLAQCPPAIQARLLTADLVLAKGQGNYETLLGWGRPTLYLFVVKCAVVSGMTGEPLGTPMVLLN